MRRRRRDDEGRGPTARQKVCVFRDPAGRLDRRGRRHRTSWSPPAGLAQVEGLNLEVVGVHADPQHGIEVDDYLQTHSSRVYAIGDVLMRQQSAQAAEREADVVFQNAILRLRKRMDDATIPRATFVRSGGRRGGHHRGPGARGIAGSPGVPRPVRRD